MKFASPDGDHLTLLAVISGHDEVVAASRLGFCNGVLQAKGTMEWCKDNFVNKRNVRKVSKDRSELVQD